MSENYSNYDKILSSVPGRSPWYLLSKGPKLSSKHGTLSWKKVGDKEVTMGKVSLINPHNKPLAIIDSYCYVLNMKGSNFLVWHIPEKFSFTQMNSSVQIKIIDANKLKVIESIEEALSIMKKNEIKVYHNKDALISFLDISKELKLGINKIKIPKEFKEIEELLTFGPSNSVTKKRFLRYQMNYALYILKPKNNIIEVIPQDWYNYGKWDFDYEGPIRYARDPVSNKIFVEGFRIGKFVLDNSGRKIEKWIEKPNYL